MEKFHIAKEHLIPENLEKYDLVSSEIKFQDEAIEEIIKSYVREAGVRELNRKIQTIIRKFILQMIEKKVKNLVVTPEKLPSYLKKKVGGDILLIEVSHSPGKGELLLTGNLGDIMKESAQNDISVHVLEGATPKEGPSAGIALTSAIISDITGQAIGGLKEKVIAAHRSKLKSVIIPKANQKDIEDIPVETRQKIKIILVAEYDEKGGLEILNTANQDGPWPLNLFPLIAIDV
ncbi:20127_t:CDS:2 [Cetraspora pellucida]|uniref:20127_t:CDS:1 n=1 Tax=Cetraspora pellucida TaxID=1433469 RepID=A0A9N8W2I8_9GLOM|nr:20127_t:CDS:2 [Cetraspora pellucida]